MRTKKKLKLMSFRSYELKLVLLAKFSSKIELKRKIKTKNKSEENE